MLMVIFWLVTACDLENSYQRFGEKKRSYLQGSFFHTITLLWFHKWFHFCTVCHTLRDFCYRIFFISATKLSTFYLYLLKWQKNSRSSTLIYPVS